MAEAARLNRVRDRRKSGLTLIEGPHLLAEALRGGAAIKTLFAIDADTGTAAIAEEHAIDLVVVDDVALKRLAGTLAPRGPVAVVEIPPPSTSGAGDMLVSWGVSDPGNVGTMIRIAAAFGWSFGHFMGSADPWSPKVLRSGAGSQFRTPIRPVSDITHLRSEGFEVVATVAHGGVWPEKLARGRWAVLIGEESAGLPHHVVSASDHRVSIPMPGGIESLNAGVAAGIVTYVLSKHTGERDGQG